MKKNLLLIAGLATSMFLASCAAETKTDVTEAAKDKATEVMDDAKDKMDKAVATVETIKLEQTEGAFTTTELSLEAGKEYNFEVTNNAGRPAALVLAKKDLEGKSVPEIMEAAEKGAMLSGPIEDGVTATSTGTVKLEAGEYFYFCPMNATPKYAVTVK